jgi:serine protease Do
MKAILFRCAPVATALAMMFASLPAVDAQTNPEHQARREVMVSVGGSRSFLGVGVAEITAERAKALKLKEERGVEITRVEDESPAAKAGLKKEDVVIEYNGQRVEGAEQFVRYVRETPPGREVKLQVIRGGQSMMVTATIASRKMRTVEAGDMQFSIPHIDIPDVPTPPIPPMPRATFAWTYPVLGVEAESLSTQLAEFFGVKEGVLVRSVAKGSAAEKAGIKAGDVITKVDETVVKSPAEVTRALRDKEKTTHSVAIVREKKEMSVTVTVEDRQERVRPRGRMVRSPEFDF